MGIRFFSVPAHRLLDGSRLIPADELIEPTLSRSPEALERALSGAEFRDQRARDWLHSLIATARTAQPTLGPGCGPAAVFARPPADLPALLRLADQLEGLAQKQTGERALVWKCQCGTRYAIPITLFRPVSIRCESCGRTVQLDPSVSVGEEALLDPLEDAANRSRHELSRFFREAMARGWPVLVCSTEP